MHVVFVMYLSSSKRDMLRLKTNNFLNLHIMKKQTLCENSMQQKEELFT